MNPFDQSYFTTQRAISTEKIAALFSLCHVAIPKELTVLDLGAGQGASPTFFSQHHNKIIIADISKEALAYQKQVCGDDKTRLLQFDFSQHWPLEDACIDFLFCNEVVEHLEADTVLFNEAHRVLKKNGKILLKTPNFWDLKRFWAPLKKEVWYGYLDKTHKYFYSPRTLKKNLKKAGFSQIRILTGTTPLWQRGNLKLPAPPLLGHGLIGYAQKN